MKINQQNLIMQFTEEITQLTGEMEEKSKRCSTTFSKISKMQANEQNTVLFPPIRMTNSLKSDNIKYWQEHRGVGTLAHC